MPLRMCATSLSIWWSVTLCTNPHHPAERPPLSISRPTSFCPCHLSFHHSSFVFDSLPVYISRYFFLCPFVLPFVLPCMSACIRPTEPLSSSLVLPVVLTFPSAIFPLLYSQVMSLSP